MKSKKRGCTRQGKKLITKGEGRREVEQREERRNRREIRRDKEEMKK